MLAFMPSISYCISIIGKVVPFDILCCSVSTKMEAGVKAAAEMDAEGVWNNK